MINTNWYLAVGALHGAVLFSFILAKLIKEQRGEWKYGQDSLEEGLLRAIVSFALCLAVWPFLYVIGAFFGLVWILRMIIEETKNG